MSLLNLSARALIANQAALQTIGHNISNVNTPGYSRQSVTLESAGSQQSGGGYIGRGVTLANVTRSHDDFLTAQATQATAVAASDSARSNSLSQLENIFPTGTSGLGQAVTDMLNAFTDVSSAPTDLTARSVVLTDANELSNRFASASTQMDSLATGTKQQLQDDVTAINGLITRISSVNQQIALTANNSQQPNDLLDQRDTLIKNLNQYVQTTQVAADDGTVNVFVGSQALVLGVSTATLSIVQDPSGDPAKLNLAVGRGSSSTNFDETALSGGEVAGLLKFNNVDLADARNQLGRMALATTTAINNQHKLGIDLNGNAGTNFFQQINIPAGYAAPSNTGTGGVTATVSDETALQASDYQVQFTSGTGGQIVRLSDGQTTAFSALGTTTVDGLNFNLTAGAAAGDSFVVKPYSTASSQVSTVFSAPNQLAAGNPVVVSTAPDNVGSVTVSGMTVTSQNASMGNDAYITFTSPTSYTITQPPAAGDVVMVQANDASINTPSADPTKWPTTYTATPSSTVGGPILTTAGNADALANLRDKTMYDGSPMSDGYAGLISELGTRVQSASYTASVSQSISSSLDSSVSTVSGVNLDEEAAKLLQFQQAYQASAKMIQVAQTLFDSALQALGG